MASSTLHLSLDKVRRSIDDDDEPFIKEDTSPVSWADALDAYDDLLEGVLTPEKLQELTGVQDLTEVTFVEMRVDTTERTLGPIGQHLCNLTQLKLSNSHIETMRDLGTSLSRVEVLWMSRCGLTDLEGVSALPGVRELFIAFNDVADLSPLMALDQLETVDLESNRVSDVAQVQFLSGCDKLISLTLEGNPVAEAAADSDAAAGNWYRRSVCAVLPQLVTFDDEDVTEKDREALPADLVQRFEAIVARNADAPGADDPALLTGEDGAPLASLADERHFVSDAIKYAKVDVQLDRPEIIATMGSSASGQLVRPMSARPSHRPAATFQAVNGRSTFGATSPAKLPSGRPPTGGRTARPPTGGSTARSGAATPRVVARPYSAMPQRPSTSLGGQRRGIDRMGSSGTLGSSAAARRADEERTSSDLTFGMSDVMCGNGIRALRGRRGDDASGSGDADATPMLPGDNLLEQLRSWKLTAGPDGLDLTGDLDFEDDEQLLARLDGPDAKGKARRSVDDNAPDSDGRRVYDPSPASEERRRASSPESDENASVNIPVGSIRPQSRRAFKIMRANSQDQLDAPGGDASAPPPS